MMPDDDWRYRKAQQLGLIDDRPLAATGDGRHPAAAATLALPRNESAATWMPGDFTPRSTGNADAAAATDGPRRLAFVGGTAIALLVATGAGWLLNDALSERSIAEFPLPARPEASFAMRPTQSAPAIAAAAPVIEAAAPVIGAAAPDVDAAGRANASPLPALPSPRPAARMATPPVASSLQSVVVRPSSPIVVPAALSPSVRVTAPSTFDAAVARRGQARLAVTVRGRPSFNCRRAQTRDSRLICASPELAGLDREMVRSYRSAVRRGGRADEYWLDKEQAAFLNARSACQTAPCIARLYYRRLDVLGAG